MDFSVIGLHSIPHSIQKLVTETLNWHTSVPYKAEIHQPNKLFLSHLIAVFENSLHPSCGMGTMSRSISILEALTKVYLLQKYLHSDQSPQDSVILTKRMFFRNLYLFFTVPNYAGD